MKLNKKIKIFYNFILKDSIARLISLIWDIVDGK